MSEEYYVSCPCKSLVYGHDVRRYFAEADRDRGLGEPGAQPVDKVTALRMVRGNPDEIVSHYLGVYVQPMG